uniref:Uncharacterized protein n=1 Tax=uncultured Bacteroidota bacterium TaxID=152509 RepID=H5SMT1_9BACT|nr:hypothetical protein HGMM_F50F04C30 [uncultured Bacteroidetes bacterium]
MHFVFFLGLSWAQYLTPFLLSSGEAQASLTNEPITANPAAFFPAARWAFRFSSAFYLPAPELAFRIGGVSFRWDSLQGMHLLLQQWNFDKLSQWETGMGYGLRLLRGRVLLATRGRLLSTNFSEYGRIHRFTPDVGVRIELSPSVALGGYGYNLLAQGWGLLPGSLRYGIGLAYGPAPSTRLLIDVSQTGQAPPQIHTAAEYSPHSNLTLRTGVGLPILTVGGGFALRYKKVAIEVGYRYQPTTGSWCAVGLAFP